VKQWQADEIRAVIEILATAEEDGRRNAEERNTDLYGASGLAFWSGVLQARIDMAVERLEGVLHRCSRD
jgi:hypothetical protein